MAASFKKVNLKVLCSISGLRGQLSYCRLQHYSTTAKGSEKTGAESEEERNEINNRLPQVGMSPDGQVLIAWHPEPTHPYEHTKPLPRTTEELTQGDSVLKSKLLKREEIRHRPHGPTIAELSNLFFTSKHRWYPLSARRKALQRKVPENTDREGI